MSFSRRRMPLLAVLGTLLALPAVPAPAATPAPPAVHAPAGLCLAPTAPQAVLLMRIGKCGRPSLAQARADTAPAPQQTSCGLPGDPAPRCPAMVDRQEPGALYSATLARSHDGRLVYSVGNAGSTVNTVVTYVAATGKRVSSRSLLLGAMAYPSAAVVSPDGRTLVVGASSGDWGAVSYAVDLPSGRLLWRAGTPRSDFYDGVTGVAFDGRGDRVLLTELLGEKAKSSVDDWRVRVVATRTGKQLWASRLQDHDGKDQFPTAAAWTGERCVVVGAEQSKAAGRDDYDAVARTYDSATGRVLSTVRKDSEAHADEGFWAAEAALGGAVAAVGSSAWGTGAGVAMVLLLDRSGRPRWSAALGPAGQEAEAYAVTWAGDRVVVAAESTPAARVNYSALPTSVAYAPMTTALDGRSGKKLWQQAAPTLPGNVRVTAISSSAGRVYVAGSSSPAYLDAYLPGPVFVLAVAPQDAYVAAFDAGNGTAVWTSRYNGDGTEFNFPLAVAATPTGVFTTGQAAKMSSHPVGLGYVYTLNPQPLVLRYDR